MIGPPKMANITHLRRERDAENWTEDWVGTLIYKEFRTQLHNEIE